MENNIDSLVADLTCDDITKCQKARRKLVTLGNPAVQPLVKELSNKKHWVRWEAVKALGQIGDKAAIDALVKALEDPEFDVRWLAAEGLVRIGHGTLPSLLFALEDHGDKSMALRQGAHHVLHDMNLGDLGVVLMPVMVAIEDTAPSFEVLQVAKQTRETLSMRGTL